MQMKGLVGLRDYESEINSPAMKSQDKRDDKGRQWQATKIDDRGDCDYLLWQGE